MGISIWQLLIVLAIVVLLFGTKKLRNIGGDLGGAIKNFKKSMSDGESGKDDDDPKRLRDSEGRVIDSEARSPDSATGTDRAESENRDKA